MLTRDGSRAALAGWPDAEGGAPGGRGAAGGMSGWCACPGRYGISWTPHGCRRSSSNKGWRMNDQTLIAAGESLSVKRLPRTRPPKSWWRLPLVLGVVVFVTIVVTACSSVVSQKQSKPAEKPSIAPTEENLGNALGPSACLTTSNASGTGAWKVVQPRTLCGQPLDTTAQGRAVDQESLQAAELTFNPLAETTNLGNYTSGFAAGYELPAGLTMSRFVNIVAFNGHFNAVATVNAMVSESAAPGEVFHPMPPGPHGGILQCAISGPDTADCVFGTATTIAYITIEDTSKELVGAQAGATAIDIRNAVEVRI